MGFPTALVIQDEKNEIFSYTDNTVSPFYCLNVTIK